MLALNSLGSQLHGTILLSLQVSWHLQTFLLKIIIRTHCLVSLDIKIRCIQLESKIRKTISTEKTGQKFKIRFGENIHDNWFNTERVNLAHHTLNISHKYNSINNITDILKIILQGCKLGLLSINIYKHIWKMRDNLNEHTEITLPLTVLIMLVRLISPF